MALTKIGGGVLRQPIDVGIITATSLNASGIVTAGTVQVGAATTVHSAGIDLGSGNITSHNINSTGIITATSFVGPVTGNTSGTASNLSGSPSINVTNITASGNVSIAGTLTYEDVTNIDSVGIITAQAGIRVTGGSVGIGLTNPEKNLVVSSSSSPTIRINNSDGSISADQTIGVIEFKANDGSNDGSQVTGSIESISQAAFTGQGSPSHLIFKTNGVSGANALTERLRITAAGLVGIGTDNPGDKLVVHQGSDDDIIVRVNGADSTTEFAALGVGAGYASFVAGGSQTTNTDMVLMTTSGGTETERLRITSAGVLNIGTGAETDNVANFVEMYVGATNGTYGTIRGKYNRTNEHNRSEVRFGVEDNSTGKGFLAFATGNNSATEKLRIKNDGKIGIGTDNPSELLHLQSGHTKQILKSTNLNTASSVIFDVANVNTADFLLGQLAGRWNGNDVAYINFEAGADTTNKDDGVITFLTSPSSSTPTERLRITAAGLIGIGNDNPTVALDVKRATAGLIGKFYDTGSNGGALYNGGPILGLSRVSNGSVSLDGLLFQVGIDNSNSTSYNIDSTIFSVTNRGVGIGINNPSSTYLLEADGPIRSGSSGSSLPKGAGFRQHAACTAGVSNRLIYNAFDSHYAEKSFGYYFPNGQSNRALRIHSNRNSWWTCGFITIHAQYSNANASGMLRYEFTHNANGTSSYGKSIDVNVNRGSTSAHFGMSSSYSFKTWGSNGGSATSHALEIRHLASSGNSCYVTIEMYGSSASTYIDDLYMTTGHTY